VFTMAVFGTWRSSAWRCLKLGSLRLGGFWLGGLPDGGVEVLATAVVFSSGTPSGYDSP